MPRVGSLLASVAFLSAAISHGECEQQQRLSSPLGPVCRAPRYRQKDAALGSPEGQQRPPQQAKKKRKKKAARKKVPSGKTDKPGGHW